VVLLEYYGIVGLILNEYPERECLQCSPFRLQLFVKVVNCQIVFKMIKELNVMNT